MVVCHWNLAIVVWNTSSWIHSEAVTAVRSRLLLMAPVIRLLSYRPFIGVSLKHWPVVYRVMGPFRLLDLPAEPLGDVLEYVPAAAVVRLWASGDSRVHFVLSLPRIVRVLRLTKAQKTETGWKGDCPVAFRFPHLHQLHIYARYGHLGDNRPDIDVELSQLCRSLKKLHLHVGNAEKMFVSPSHRTPSSSSSSSSTSSSLATHRDPEDEAQASLASVQKEKLTLDNPSCFVDSRSLLPSLACLELNGRSVLNGVWLTQSPLPLTLTRLLMPQNDRMRPRDLVHLPPQITDLSLLDFAPSTSEDDSDDDGDDTDNGPMKTFSPTLEFLQFCSRESFHGNVRNFFSRLPPGLKRLSLSSSKTFSPQEIDLLPLSLTALEGPQISLVDISQLSRFVHLSRLTFNAESCQSGITKLFPRSLDKLNIRKYKHVDDEFWRGMPKTLSQLSALTYNPPADPRFRNHNNNPSRLTRNCIPHIPPLLTTLDLGKLNGELLPEDLALLPSSLVRITLPKLDASGLEKLPRTVESITANEAEMDERFVKCMPPRLRRINFISVALTQPECFALLPTSVEDLRLSSLRMLGRETTFIFEDDWASYFPKTLRRLSLRSANRIGDELVRRLKDHPLLTLELHGREARFSVEVIVLLPRSLEWLELDGVSGWTLSEAELSQLPTKLHWMHISFLTPSNLPLLTLEELKMRLPSKLSGHNLPTIERPQPFGFVHH